MTADLSEAVVVPRKIARSVAGIALPFAVYIGVQFAVDAWSRSAVYGAIVGALALVALSPIYKKIKTAPPSASQRLAFSNRRPAVLLAFGTILLPVWLGGQLCAILLWQIWPETHAGYEAHNQRLDSAPVALTLALTVLLAPVAEELLFRGVLYRELRDGCHLPPVLAAALSMLVFSAVHGNAVQSAATIMLGLLLAFAYELTRTVVVPVALHVVFNLLSTFVPVAVVQAFFAPVQMTIVLVTAVASLVLLGVHLGENQRRIRDSINP